MMKSFWKKSICAVGLALLLSGTSWAVDVTSEAVNISAAHSSPVYVPLKLVSSKVVAGINGQLDYDPNLFTNPQIQKSLPTQNFNVLGNLVAPGQYKFVIYADPTASINTKDPIVYFRLETNPGTAANLSTLSFSTAAASDPSAISLTSAFANIQINVLENRNAASDWAIYE